MHLSKARLLTFINISFSQKKVEAAVGLDLQALRLCVRVTSGHVWWYLQQCVSALWTCKVVLQQCGTALWTCKVVLQ